MPSTHPPSKRVTAEDHKHWRETQRWVTADRRMLKIKDLTDSHLANIIRWVSYDLPSDQEYVIKNGLCKPDYPQELRHLLIYEAGFRGLSPNYLAAAPHPRTP